MRVWSHHNEGQVKSSCTFSSAVNADHSQAALIFPAVAVLVSKRLIPISPKNSAASCNTSPKHTSESKTWDALGLFVRVPHAQMSRKLMRKRFENPPHPERAEEEVILAADRGVLGLFCKRPTL